MAKYTIIYTDKYKRSLNDFSSLFIWLILRLSGVKIFNVTGSYVKGPTLKSVTKTYAANTDPTSSHASCGLTSVQISGLYKIYCEEETIMMSSLGTSQYLIEVGRARINMDTWTVYIDPYYSTNPCSITFYYFE